MCGWVPAPPSLLSLSLQALINPIKTMVCVKPNLRLVFLQSFQLLGWVGEVISQQQTISEYGNLYDKLSGRS